MFAADRWAAAYMAVVAASGKGGAEEGLGFLKALAPCLEPVSSVFYGHSSAAWLESSARRDLEISGAPVVPGGGLETALRLAVLLVRKSLTRHIGRLAEAVEECLDRENGLVTALVESAGPLDEPYQDALKAVLKQKTAAREIRLTLRQRPELLGGCRLRIGAWSLDGSIQGQLRKMARDLQAGGVSW